jgi:hypothetical protein
MKSTTSFAVAILMLMSDSSAFHVPHTRHQHPFDIRYRQEQLEQDFILEESTKPSTTDRSRQAITTIESSSDTQLLPNEWQLMNATLSTPISYDEETGMVQTAVRAIVQHPISSIVVDNHVVGLSSTLVIATGALHEIVDCVQLEWTHHATQSTEGLALLSLGHFLHYGRETVRQLVELQHQESKSKSGIAREAVE